MSTPKKKKAPKKRADKYEEKLSISGTFEQVIGVVKKNAQKKKDAGK